LPKCRENSADSTNMLAMWVLLSPEPSQKAKPPASAARSSTTWYISATDCRAFGSSWVKDSLTVPSPLAVTVHVNTASGSNVAPAEGSYLGAVKMSGPGSTASL
jgi:hypothetical protein